MRRLCTLLFLAGTLGLMLVGCQSGEKKRKTLFRVVLFIGKYFICYGHLLYLFKQRTFDIGDSIDGNLGAVGKGNGTGKGVDAAHVSSVGDIASARFFGVGQKKG